MSKATVLDPKQKIDVVNALHDNPKKTANEIAEMLGINKGSVIGVKVWYNKKGRDLYLAELEGTISDMDAYIEKVLKSNAKNINNSGGKPTFTNFKGVGKIEARQRMVSHIKASGIKTGQILTLPAATWAIEKQLDEEVSKRFGYTACERDPDVFPLMIKKAFWYGSKTKNKPVFGTTTEMIYEAKEDEYSHLILDYCGNLDSFRKEITYACNNNIVKKGGIIAVTLLKARCNDAWVRKVNEVKHDWTGEDVSENPNNHAYPSYFTFMAAITDFEVVETFNYRDSVPMSVIILKRTS